MPNFVVVINLFSAAIPNYQLGANPKGTKIRNAFTKKVIVV